MGRGGALRRLRGWLSLGCALAVCVAFAYAAYIRASQAWDGVVSYATPYAEVPLPASAATPPVAERVIFIIVDGLRADAAASMSSIRSMGGYGSRISLEAPQPSLSYPNWTTLLTGTTQDYHGVVTNWHDGAAPVESIFDTAERSGLSYVVVGPSDIATLYPAAARADAAFFREWSKEYMSATYIDAALKLIERVSPRLTVVHLPDVDEAGHAFGGASSEYAQTVAKIDADLRRLIEGLQGEGTAFVITSDHGHIDTGGHGGWEPEAVEVPCVFAGTGFGIGEGQAVLADVAPTVAVAAGMPIPRFATGVVLRSVLATDAAAGVAASANQRSAAMSAFASIIREPLGSTAPVKWDASTPPDVLDAYLESTREARLDYDRSARARGVAPVIVLAALVVLAVVGFVSWRALAASLAGASAYYVVYNGLFFVVHGNRWSLSSFNSEDLIDAWMNQRLFEAALAGLAAALVAGVVYPLLRAAPKGPRGTLLPGWLALGPVAVLVTQATLLVQVAWFEWAWGVEPTWGLPDLKWGFKFDLDLVQITALGAAALLAPVVSYLVGRYHPKVRTRSAEGT